MNLKKNRFPSTASMLLVLASIAALIFAWSSPLLSTPTGEAALFLGIFLAPLCYIAGICRGALRSNKGFVNDVYREGTWVFFAVLGYFLTILIHSWSFQSCSPSSGILPFVAILVPQLCLSLVTGVWLGRLVGRLHFAVVLGLAIWALYTGFHLALWWSNPSMRFYDPYWFLLAGDLLKGQELPPTLVAYRMSALLYAAALFVLGMPWKKHATQFWLVFFLGASALVVQVKSSALISPSLRERKKDYPDVLVRGPITLHTRLASVGEDHAQGILQEASFWLERLKQRTGIETHRSIDIWLYDSMDSLAHHTGAKHVHFTLPAHRQIHITHSQIPHPTLGHEIAHVLIGEIGGTLWGLPGVFGVLPNLGLSEGLATYLTPELSLQNDLDLKEQAAALYRLGFEKHPENLLETDLWSFWSQSSSRAYVASAALLGSTIDKQCHTQVCRAKAVRRLAEAGQVNLRDSFLNAYRLELQNLPLPPDALPSVANDFSEKSVLLATCEKGSTVQAVPQNPTAALKTDELPIYRQRELAIKSALVNDAPYAKASLELLNAKPEDVLTAGAAYGKLGYFLGKANDNDLSKDSALYLLSRFQILAGNFDTGLLLMPTNLEGWVGQESKRLYALAKSQVGQSEQAVADFDDLRNKASRPADKIRFSDMAERARAISLGERFLLGVWPKH